VNVNDILLEIIKKKHRDLNLGRNYKGKFSKIKDFEGNAIGQIGEEFTKKMLSNVTDIQNDGVIHDEYDIETTSGIRFEIKTARKGRKNDTFQFNGINPAYNYHYLLCIGITENELYYRIFEKTDIQYQHRVRKYFLKTDEYEKQLVAMNPGNSVNYKATINKIDMLEASSFLECIKNICK